uniref:Uncharacterized protein n=1 Tax=Rhodosorus marinus TaxID=101924 RepID=A0A7S3ACL5_9RHOD|mmetsp:Transcript_9677/g.41561  ORF Transcript_9677/g.41561 Transcript_9677/m.41561 type:complete len:106 (+) Transcript_9677:220-537(+)
MEFPERSKRTDIGSAVASGFVFSSSLKFGRGRSVEMCVEQRNGGSRHKTKRFRKRSAIRKPTLDIPADIGKVRTESRSVLSGVLKILRVLLNMLLSCASIDFSVG